MNSEFVISLDLPPVFEVVSSFDVFIVLHVPKNVNMFFELFYFIFELSKYRRIIYIIYKILYNSQCNKPRCKPDKARSMGSAGSCAAANGNASISICLLPSRKQKMCIRHIFASCVRSHAMSSTFLFCTGS